MRRRCQGRRFRRLSGIKTASVDVSKKLVTVSYDADKINDTQVRQSIADLGFKADQMKAKSATCKDGGKCCTDKKGNKSNDAEIKVTTITINRLIVYGAFGGIILLFVTIVVMVFIIRKRTRNNLS